MGPLRKAKKGFHSLENTAIMLHRIAMQLLVARYIVTHTICIPLDLCPFRTQIKRNAKKDVGYVVLLPIDASLAGCNTLAVFTYV